MKFSSILLLSLGLVSGAAMAGGTTEAGVGGALGGVLGSVVGQQLGDSQVFVGQLVERCVHGILLPSVSVVMACRTGSRFGICPLTQLLVQGGQHGEQKLFKP